MSMNTIVIILGPTASGKTHAALNLASALQGAVINCDSMQVYDHLSILTARPSHEERSIYKDIPYALDGVLRGQATSNVGWWLDQAVHHIQYAWSHHRLPIVVGGTGLYAKALITGLCAIPTIPTHIKDYVRTLSSQPFEDLKAWTIQQAPFFEQYTDPQRLLRAYEVFLATGKPITFFYHEQKPPLDARMILITLQPDRKILHDRINARFSAMMDRGVLDEVAQFEHNLKSTPLQASHPILKATGLSSLRQYLQGEISKDEAILRAQQHTRQYAKRQITWMRSQMNPDIVIDPFTQSSWEYELQEHLHRIQDQECV